MAETYEMVAEVKPVSPSGSTFGPLAGRFVTCCRPIQNLHGAMAPEDSEGVLLPTDMRFSSTFPEISIITTSNDSRNDRQKVGTKGMEESRK
jgi:hypothetical protein